MTQAPFYNKQIIRVSCGFSLCADSIEAPPGNTDDICPDESCNGANNIGFHGYFAQLIIPHRAAGLAVSPLFHALAGEPGPVYIIGQIIGKVNFQMIVRIQANGEKLIPNLIPQLPRLIQWLYTYTICGLEIYA